MNFMRTGVLLAAMTALFMIVGLGLGGRTGMMIALAIAIATNVFAYWNSDRMALAANDAHEVDASTAPDLVRLVGELAQRAQLPMPRVYMIDSDQPNAFATGRDPQHAAVAVNSGLMQMLTREELAGVIAHELAHIKHRDTLTMTITATLAGAISSIAHWGMFMGGQRNNGGTGIIGSIALAILAPMAAMIVQMAVSRSREYETDRIGAAICGNPYWLARALAKISQGAEAIPNAAAEAHPAMAHMFIINPLSGQGMDNLFSTHPNVENRIAALEQLAMQHGIHDVAAAPAPQTSWAPFRNEGQGGSFLDGNGIGNGAWNQPPDRANGSNSNPPRGPWG
jgi:heat shock protein HtpX